MIKVAIAGGTGYTAGELLRILVNHPEVEIGSVLSTTSAGKEISSFHTDLLGETDIRFTDTLEPADVLFLCLGHGLSREFIDTHDIPAGCHIIDLGNDFRTEPDYKGMHFVYGLPEFYQSEIAKTKYVANPGCFATCIQLGSAPLAKAGLINDEIHVTAITGSTGAGRKLSDTGHFSYRNNNISVYKSFTHQQLAEICDNLGKLSGKEVKVNFVPMRGDFTRGIFESIYTKCEASEDEAIAIYKEFYKDSPFVFVSDQPISLKQVVNTNKALINIAKHGEYLHITSEIDNLLKGASGQAVENMNIMMGYERTCALKLKAPLF